MSGVDELPGNDPACPEPDDGPAGNPSQELLNRILSEHKCGNHRNTCASDTDNAEDKRKQSGHASLDL